MQDVISKLSGETLLLLFAIVALWLNTRQNRVQPDWARSLELEAFREYQSLQASAAGEMKAFVCELDGFERAYSDARVSGESKALAPELSELLTRLLQTANCAVEKIARAEECIRRIAQRPAPLERQRQAGGRNTPADAKSIRSAVAMLPTESAKGRNEFGTRREPQRLYATEYLAPYNGISFPESDAFSPVECFDLSRDSVSFFLPRPPTNERFVIALGSATEPIFAAIKVLRTVSTDRHFVDCLLVKRLEAPAHFSLPNRSAEPTPMLTCDVGSGREFAVSR